MAVDRRFIIGVMGSHDTEWQDFSEALGSLIATLGFHILTGAGAGVMTAAARGFCNTQPRAGSSIGIVPTEADAKGGFAMLEGYPNAWIEIPIVTPLRKGNGGTISRNHVNILTSNVVVALPGGTGTKDEIQLATAFNKPLMLFGTQDAFADFDKAIARTDKLADIEQFILLHTQIS